MPTLYFRAKELWEARRFDEGFALLHDALASSLGMSPFDLSEKLVDSSLPPDFDSTVALLLTAKHFLSARTLLKAPFASTLAELWRLDRYQHWIELLLRYNFFSPPDAGPTDFEDHVPPANTPADLARLCGVLDADVRAGRLSNDPHNQPNGGRPVLTLRMIDEVDEGRWGELKPMLRERLTGAYADAPKDPWAQRLSTEPEVIALEALHDVFGRYRSSPAAAQPRWEAIRRDHAAYASAARAALEIYARGADPALLAETARIDAGIPVSDGAHWFASLLRALDDGNFAPLAAG